MTTEHSDLLKAVLTTRDKIDPDLDAELLKAIVDAETVYAADGDQAISAIDTAVTSAIERGVSAQSPPSAPDAIAENEGDEDED